MKERRLGRGQLLAVLTVAGVAWKREAGRVSVDRRDSGASASAARLKVAPTKLTGAVWTAPTCVYRPEEHALARQAFRQRKPAIYTPTLLAPATLDPF